MREWHAGARWRTDNAAKKNSWSQEEDEEEDFTAVRDATTRHGTARWNIFIYIPTLHASLEE
jgi:hypothetical protein